MAVTISHNLVTVNFLVKNTKTLTLAYLFLFVFLHKLRQVFLNFQIRYDLWAPSSKSESTANQMLMKSAAFILILPLRSINLSLS